MGAVAAAVQQQDDLSSLLERFAHGLPQRGAEDPPAPLARKRQPHVHQLHPGKRQAVDALRKAQEGEASLLGQVIAFQGGGSRSEHHGHVLLLRAVQGDGSGVVAGGAFLFEGAFVLLVHHDQAKPSGGSEHGTAGSHHYVEPSLGDLLPVPAPLLIT